MGLSKCVCVGKGYLVIMYIGVSMLERGVKIVYLYYCVELDSYSYFISLFLIVACQLMQSDAIFSNLEASMNLNLNHLTVLI